jgi:ankyrin repeat protein
LPETQRHPAPTADELALLKAAYAGDLQKVQTLVGGANINAQSNEFYDMGMHQDVTPLMCAAAQGHLEVVNWLLKHGANHAAETMLTKSEGGPGTQALHFAAAGGHEAVVIALLDAGANLNAEGRSGRTPLISALGQGKLSCTRLLLRRGALGGIQSKHKQFEPPLFVLAKGLSNTTELVTRNGKMVPIAKDLWDQKEVVLELIQSLLAAGADPNATGPDRDGPLSRIACRVPAEISLPIARMLIEKGANPDHVSKSGNSPLMTAVFFSSYAFSRQLLEHPVDVNRLCPRGTVLDVVESDIESAEDDIKSESDADARAKSETELKELRSLRELLISRGAKHKSELPSAPAEGAKAEKRHVASDFLKLAISTDDSVWAMLAVKAPFEAVSDGYFKFTKSKTRQQNAPVRPAADGEEVAPLATVAKIMDSPWTIIQRTIFYLRSPDVKHVASAAKELSKSLDTRAITWCGSGDTQYGRCEVFDSGESTAKATGAKVITLLTKEAVPCPAFYPARSGEQSWVAVEKPSLGIVERADLIAR